MFQQIVLLKECNSTNVYLKKILEDKFSDAQLIIRAEFQSRGKGQGSKQWESAKGENLLFSFNVNHENLFAKNQFIISAVVALSIVDVLAQYVAKESITIKWPNDIYVGNKKIAGILIENNVKSDKLNYSIVGVGININQKRFFSNAPNPVSLFQITNATHDVSVLLKRFISSFEKLNLHKENGDYDFIMDEYLKNMFRINQLHKYKINGKEQNGIIRGVDDYGFLKIEISQKEYIYDIGVVEYLF